MSRSKVPGRLEVFGKILDIVWQCASRPGASPDIRIVLAGEQTGPGRRAHGMGHIVFEFNSTGENTVDIGCIAKMSRIAIVAAHVAPSEVIGVEYNNIGL